MFYDFPYIGNFIIPTDEVISFRGVGLNHQPELDAITVVDINHLLGTIRMDINIH